MFALHEIDYDITKKKLNIYTICIFSSQTFSLKTFFSKMFPYMVKNCELDLKIFCVIIAATIKVGERFYNNVFFVWNWYENTAWGYILVGGNIVCYWIINLISIEPWFGNVIFRYFTTYLTRVPSSFINVKCKHTAYWIAIILKLEASINIKHWYCFWPLLLLQSEVKWFGVVHLLFVRIKDSLF